MKGAFLASANCGNRAKNGEKSCFTANKLSTYAQSFATAPGLRAPEIGIFTEISSKFNLLSTADPRDLAVYRREISMSTRKRAKWFNSILFSVRIVEIAQKRLKTRANCA